MTEDAKEREIPLLPSRGYDVDTFFRFSTAVENLFESVDYMANRLEATGHLEDVKRIAAETKNILLDISKTFYPEKREVLAKLSKSAQTRIVFRKSVTPEPDAVWIFSKELQTLISKAHEECKLCMHPERCKSCDLGKAFDRCISIDREKTSWQNIDVDEF